MNTRHLFLFVLLTCAIGCSTKETTNSREHHTDSFQQLLSENISVVENNYRNVLQQPMEVATLPYTVDDDGALKTDPTDGWVSGFFPGTLWYLYELTGKEEWKNEATKWTEKLDSIQYLKRHHDIGFMIYCSYGNAYRLTQNQAYKSVIANAAQSLSTRFSEQVKCFSSWPEYKPWGSEITYDYPVIIDNMMNLELMYEGAKITGDSLFSEMATTHAKTTIKNHFRKDFSSYHVVLYDKKNGQVLDKKTCQGYADNSSWARGQAWGLYGYTLCYRETNDPQFLRQAEAIANFIMTNENIPSDRVPFWDYNIQQEGYASDWATADTDVYPGQKDVSSASITASALLELSQYSDQGGTYKNYAREIIESLSSEKYRFKANKNNFFLLDQSVASVPHGALIGKPLNYADYYFLEALTRYKKLEEGHDLIHSNLLVAEQL